MGCGCYGTQRTLCHLEIGVNGFVVVKGGQAEFGRASFAEAPNKRAGMVEGEIKPGQTARRWQKARETSVVQQVCLTVTDLNQTR